MKTLRILLACFPLSLSLSPSLLAASADPTGVWKWTTPNRNGQPQETILKLDVAQDGTVTGTLTDRTGTTPITDASVKGDKVEFSLLRETPSGEVETKYSLKLEGENLKVTVERPDRSPGAAAQNKQRKTDITAVRSNVPAPTPRPKG